MTERRHPRVPLRLQVEYQTPAAFLVAYSANLSKGGVFLETDEVLPPGTRLTLQFVVAGHMPTIEGEVAWVRTGDDGQPGLGIRFVDPDDEQLGLVIDSLAVGFKGVTVVVVAAGRASRAQITRLLRSLISSATVVEAGTAREAEGALASGADLAIIDLDGAGHDALAAIRTAKLRHAGAIPVIALAADDLQKMRAEELAVDRVIGNPPASAEIHEAVIGALGRPTRVGGEST